MSYYFDDSETQRKGLRSGSLKKDPTSGKITYKDKKLEEIELEDVSKKEKGEKIPGVTIKLISVKALQKESERQK